MRREPTKGDRHLRASVLFAVAVEALFIVFFTVFLFKHADPMGDGMEMVGASAAFMLIFLPFSLPAFLLAKFGRWLPFAAFLAGLAAILMFLFWLEMLDEIGVRRHPGARCKVSA
jgi:drug/metabolite transporter (DMT)-like permease